MKKLIFLTALILITGSASCQPLQEGNFIGLHVYTINLEPNVTWDQFNDFWKSKVFPEIEKNFECKVYEMKGVRGECTNCIAMMIVWKTESDRDKFFNNGGFNDAGNAAMSRIQPLLDQLKKLGTSTFKYTDWIIQ